MVMKLFTLLFCVSSLAAFDVPNTSRGRALAYLDSAFLKEYDTAAAALRLDGYQDVSFLSTDGLRLNGLFRYHPQAKATFIVCAGFYPGRKESFAHFTCMLPEDYNILLFDARGHGKSAGSLFGTLDTYGIHEYKDVLGAIMLAQARSATPIVLYGCCSGAFHAARALLALESCKEIQKYNIRGLIFDSGWASVSEAARTVPLAYIQRYMSMPLISWLYPVVAHFVHYIQSRYLLPAYTHSDATITLYNKMHAITVPILYIHSLDDQAASCEPIKKLAQETSQKMCWWIPQSTSYHAGHHHKLPYEFTLNTRLFCNRVIG